MFKHIMHCYWFWSTRYMADLLNEDFILTDLSSILSLSNSQETQFPKTTSRLFFALHVSAITQYASSVWESTFFVWGGICSFAHRCVSRCLLVCMCMCVEARGQYQVSFSAILHLIIETEGLTDLEAHRFDYTGWPRSTGDLPTTPPAWDYTGTQSMSSFYSGC